jgi:hypothetical protein
LPPSGLPPSVLLLVSPLVPPPERAQGNNFCGQQMDVFLEAGQLFPVAKNV